MRKHHRILIAFLTLLALGVAWRLAHGAEPLDRPDRSPPPPPSSAGSPQGPPPVKQVGAEYPRAALDSGVQGTVWIRVRTDRLGRVASAKVTRGIPGLDGASLAAVRQWVFATRMPDGKPAPNQFEVPVRFTIHGDGGPPPPPPAGSPPAGPRPVDGTIAPYPDPRGPGASPGGHVLIDEMPSLIHRVEPVVTPEMRRRRLKGTVLLQLFVGRDGRVIDARVSQSVAGLDSSALTAVRQWRFQPARSNGRPVDTWVAMPVRF